MDYHKAMDGALTDPPSSKLLPRVLPVHRIRFWDLLAQTIKPKKKKKKKNKKTCLNNSLPLQSCIPASGSASSFITFSSFPIHPSPSFHLLFYYCNPLPHCAFLGGGSRLVVAVAAFLQRQPRKCVESVAIHGGWQWQRGGCCCCRVRARAAMGVQGQASKALSIAISSSV